MNREILIKQIEEQKGNLARNGTIYITPENMRSFIDLIVGGFEQDFLVTPYLIGGIEGGIAEIYEFEFTLSIENVAASHFSWLKQREGEVPQNSFPKAVVALKDEVFLRESIEKYLCFMEKQSFSQFREAHETLQNADLFYQIF